MDCGRLLQLTNAENDKLIWVDCQKVSYMEEARTERDSNATKLYLQGGCSVLVRQSSNYVMNQLSKRLDH